MYFNLQPILENDLVLLRPLNEEDLEPLYQVAKDPLIWEQHPCRDRYKRAVFEDFFKDSLDSNGALIAIDKEMNEVIGSSRFKKIMGAEYAVEIGWTFLSRKYWGGKYNKLVKALMIDYAFNSIDDIIFYVGKENIRSQKAVEKIGGIRITGSKYQNLIKKSETDYMYRINKNNWRPDSAKN